MWTMQLLYSAVPVIMYHNMTVCSQFERLPLKQRLQQINFNNNLTPFSILWKGNFCTTQLNIWKMGMWQGVKMGYLYYLRVKPKANITNLNSVTHLNNIKKKLSITIVKMCQTFERRNNTHFSHSNLNERLKDSDIATKLMISAIITIYISHTYYIYQPYSVNI